MADPSETVTEPPEEVPHRLLEQSELTADLNPAGLVDLAMDFPDTSAETLPGFANWVPPSPDELQQSIPKYRITEMIAHGGMGAVYKAWHPRLHKYFGIKVLPPHFASLASFRTRFEREARTLATLKHDNIVKVYDLEETESHLLYLCMDYVDGQDLGKWMKAGEAAPEENPALQPPLTILQKTRIVHQTASALRCAHEAGILHRDVKPGNILVDGLRNAKLVDFGLAKGGPDDLKSNITLAGMVLGTYNYMAPEQHDGQTEDPRSDLYALGVVYYELLTGKLPQGKFPMPTETPGVTRDMQRCILKALENKLENRYQNAAAMEQDLADIVKELAASAKPARRKWLLGAAAAAVVGIAAWIGMPRPTAPQPPPPPPQKTEPQPTNPVAPRANPTASADWVAAPPREAFVDFLGQAYVPLPGRPDSMLAKHEVRILDFQAFVAETGHQSPGTRPERRETDVWADLLTWENPGFPQKPDHPVVCVSWKDADAYSAWLTKKARAKGELQPGQEYRLPTDAEWDLAAGLKTPAASFPADRGNAAPLVFKSQSPTGARLENVKIGSINYTASVGSFPGDINGYKDMGGNVREWVQDLHDFPDFCRSSRSCGYRSSDKATRNLSRRTPAHNGFIAADLGNDTLGFRLLLDRRTPELRQQQVALEKAIAAFHGTQPPPVHLAARGFVNAEGMTLDLSAVQEVSSLEAFTGLPLTTLITRHGKPLSLKPLEGMPLSKVWLHGPVVSLLPLEKAPLIALLLDQQFAPLDHPLADFQNATVSRICLRNLTLPLELKMSGLPSIARIYTQNCPVSSLKWLTGIPLEHLELHHPQGIDAELLGAVNKASVVTASRCFFHQYRAIEAEGGSAEALTAEIDRIKNSIKANPWYPGKDESWSDELEELNKHNKDKTMASLLAWHLQGRPWPPPQSVDFQGHRYLMLTTPDSVENHRRFAAMLGAHLVSINGADELEFLKSSFIPTTSNQWHLTAAYRSKRGGPWRWTTGEPWLATLPQPGGDDSSTQLELSATGLRSFTFARAERRDFIALLEWEPSYDPLPLDKAAESFYGTWQLPYGQTITLERRGGIAGYLHSESYWLLEPGSQLRAFINVGQGYLRGRVDLEGNKIVFTDLAGYRQEWSRLP